MNGTDNFLNYTSFDALIQNSYSFIRLHRLIEYIEFAYGFEL